MKVTPLEIPDVLLIEPRVFTDDRGSFLESWNESRYREAGITARFVQDNVSTSRRGVIRGLHYQEPNGQAKLVSVLHGAVYDVAVDIRRGSPTFGRWVGAELSAENARQLYIPEGFAHGFAVLSETAIFSYKCSALYDPGSEGSVRWNDPALDISWPTAAPIISEKDGSAPALAEIPLERLPV